MHKLEVDIWGIKVSAEGVIAVVAAVVIVEDAKILWQGGEVPTDVVLG